MFSRSLFAAAAFLLPLSLAAPPAWSSSSAGFDAACVNYYRQGLDPDVRTSDAAGHCMCQAARIGEERTDVLDFLGRTYSDDLTTFIHEYRQGEAWMQESFAADDYCKNSAGDGGGGLQDGGEEAGSESGFPIEARSWGGVVRAGPGTQFERLATLRENDPIVLLERTDVVFNDFPWFRIAFGNKREGYHWGGIVCGRGIAIEGAYGYCTQD